MKKKNLSSLKLRKSKISNLNLLNNRFGGYNTGGTDSITETLTQTETNPNGPINTLYCEETETCETNHGYGGCNTNDTTRGQQAPSLQMACNAMGSVLGC